MIIINFYLCACDLKATTDMDHVMSGPGLCDLWVQGSAAAAYTDRAEQPGQWPPSAVSALPDCKHPRVTDTRAFKLHQMLPSDLWNTVYKEGLLAIQPSWQWSHPGNGCQCEGDPGFVQKCENTDRDLSILHPEIHPSCCLETAGSSKSPMSWGV